MDAVIKGIEFHKNRLLGNSSDNASTLKPHEFQLPPTEQESATLFQASKDFWDEYSKNWKARSKIDYRIALDHIVDTLGAETPSPYY